MKKVYLTSGPRGAGKSTYIKHLVNDCPEIIVISRDEILISLFGKTSINPETGGHDRAFNNMFGTVKRYLMNATSYPNAIILDCYNDDSSERVEIIEKLRSLGVDEIYNLFFIISEDLCWKWYKQKPDIRAESKYCEDLVRYEHALYYHHSENIEKDGFDEVIYINSDQLRFNF